MHIAQFQKNGGIQGAVITKNLLPCYTFWSCDVQETERDAFVLNYIFRPVQCIVWVCTCLQDKDIDVYIYIQYMIMGNIYLFTIVNVHLYTVQFAHFFGDEDIYATQ